MLPKSGEVVLQGSQTPREAARFRVEATHVDSPAAKPEMEGWIHFAQLAEEAGIESVLVALNRHEPDPLMVSCALGRATKQLKFIVAYRSGLMQPTIFVQQVNTLSGLIDGRVDLNIVAGSSTAEQHGYGDFLAHDERYARAEEFLTVCNAFWRSDDEVNFEGKHYRVEKGKLNTPFISPDRSKPEIYISGHSEPSEQLVRSQGTCWTRVVDKPEKLAPAVTRMRAAGINVCLRSGLICRPTREEAVDVAKSILPEDKREQTTSVKDDSQMYREAAAVATDAIAAHWMTTNLWAGLVPHYGPVWTALVGSPRELAEAFIEYKKIGVTDFILSGWPEIDEVKRFGREVVPLVREAEQRV